MSITSTTFLFLFLPLLFPIYYLAPKPLKNTILLGASLLFYIWGNPADLIILLLSILLNYIFANIIDLKKEKKTVSKLLLVITVIFNLFILALYKYAGFILDNINSLFNLSIDPPNLSLPLGISFFTFQGISYVIDVYRNHAKSQKNLVTFALYIAMFPKISQGPIVRYHTIAEQLEERKESLAKLVEGIQRFITGLAKKLFIANNCGVVADHVFSTPASDLSIGLAWIGIIAYTLQIYFDFSGYTDMAIGLGKMFGFDLPENFNFPYISKSVSEFWRRWHMSLSSWFRDYLYIPLGGNRGTALQTYRNIFIVWMSTGVWHGAAWTFVAWGIYYGIIIMLEKAFILKLLKKFPVIFQHIYTLLLIVFGWVLFRAESITYAFNYLKSMVGLNNNTFWETEASFYLIEYRIILLLGIVFSMPVVSFVKKKILSVSTRLYSFVEDVVVPVVYLLLFLLTIAGMVSSTFNPFIYQRF